MPGVSTTPGIEMIGELGRHRLVRQLVGVCVGGDQLLRHLPDGIVASEEDDAAPLQRRNGIVVSGEHSLRILEVLRIGFGGLLLEDERVSVELGEFRELILVPHRLVDERKMRRRVGRRDTEEVRVLERKDLRVGGIAHQVEPWAGDVDVVEELFWSAAIGQHFAERLVIPCVGGGEDHRDRLERAPARRLGQPGREVGQRFGACGRRHRLGRFRRGHEGGSASGDAEAH